MAPTTVEKFFQFNGGTVKGSQLREVFPEASIYEVVNSVSMGLDILDNSVVAMVDLNPLGLYDGGSNFEALTGYSSPSSSHVLVKHRFTEAHWNAELFNVCSAYAGFLYLISEVLWFGDFYVPKALVGRLRGMGTYHWKVRYLLIGGDRHGEMSPNPTANGYFLTKLFSSDRGSTIRVLLHSSIPVEAYNSMVRDTVEEFNFQRLIYDKGISDVF